MMNGGVEMVINLSDDEERLSGCLQLLWLIVEDKSFGERGVAIPVGHVP